MEFFSKTLLIVATSMSLLACGGGGGGDTNAPATAPVVADPADKYVGAWGACIDDSNTTTTTTTIGTTTTTITSSSAGENSARVTLQMTKSSATVLEFQSTATAHKGVGCTGTGTNLSQTTASVGTFTIVGSKSVGGVTADKVQATSNLGSGKDLMHVSSDGLKLITSDPGKGNDAEGFPNALDTDLVFTKQ